MTNCKKHKLQNVLAILLSVIMVLSYCPLSVFASEVITNGDWTITNEDASGTATLSDIGFTYYSPTTVFLYGSSGGKYYVKSTNTNGSASNGIVTTSAKSYCDFTPTADGTLTVYVGNASTKTGYFSRTNTTTSTSEALGSFVPGGTDDYTTDILKVEQGTTWATASLEVEAGYTYYLCLSGSKMLCYGADYVPYTPVSGTITDSYNLDSYALKFTNKTTGDTKDAVVSSNTYSILLKPGYQYSVALTGSNSVGYAISNSTRLVDVAVADSLTANLSIEQSVSYNVSGSISGLASGYSSSDLKLVFIPEDTTSHESVNAAVDTTALTYSAQLVANETYTLSLVGAYDYTLNEAVTVYNETADPVTKAIALTAVPTYAVSGSFLGLTQVRGEYSTLAVTPTAISFKNVDDNYQYSGTPAEGSYSVSLRDGVYLASITCDNYTTSTHVTVSGGAVVRNLLFKYIGSQALEYTDKLYVGSDKAYKSIQSAVDAVANMTRTSEQRVTIMVDPGTYREQVVVNTPNITFESNGGSSADTIISWYYGIGYKYYSCVNSLYDPYADYDKYEKGNAVSYWGSAVIVQKAGTGFRANGIKFENSFNKYMTEDELTDGVEVNGLQAITVARKETTNVDTRAATERAAALVNYADKTEFANCSFIGSQDTLYTCNVEYDAYYKNCYIEGQTDFIYGNGDVIFDGCEINFCGYDGTQASGYLTANSRDDSHAATDGYIFRNCYISYSNERDVTPGYWGRMWGSGAKVSFINTQLQESDMISGAGWVAMTVDPTESTVQLAEYNTTYNGVNVDTSSRVNGVVDNADLSTYSVENVFIDKGWTPAFYTVDATTTPTFNVDPTFTSNGDLNAPNPGETITLGYTLGSDWADEDASRIAWYAVDTTYDNSSIETILQSSTLLKVTSAVSTNKFQIPMDCAGKYIMAVVTPISIYGETGTAKYIIDTEKEVSNTWSDPDNQGSLAPGEGINVYLAGDSTVKDYSADGIYNGGKVLEAGSWGEYLQYFFDDSAVTVNNYAQGGRSSRSFLNEGKLDTIANQLKDGDYLLIQFGHNDCANGASYYKERFAPLYTTDNPYDGTTYPTVLPTESLKVATPSDLQSSYGDTYYSWDCGATYKGYIQYYINVALSKGATPIIVSPVSRLYYDSTGKIKAHHDATATDYAPTSTYLTSNDAYVTACEELYEANKDSGVLYLDGFGLTKSLYEDAYTACGSNVNGQAVMASGDSTHSNKTGGVIQAGIFAKWLQDANLSLSQYVEQPTSVYGETPTGDYIFTIKNSTFTALDNSYTQSSYWTNYGQTLFDSLTGAVNTISLNFASDDALALYETNADTTYTDGVYSGKYTNSSKAVFEASVYQSGISYYNSTVRYGTKAQQKKPIFSFVADKAANYTVTVSASTGSGTVGLYSDSSCSTAVATATAPGTITYKKTDATPETLYFGTSEALNMYVSEVTISAEVPKGVNLNFGADSALALYETNADTTYTNGVYTGEYTNASGTVFETSIYQSGIQYFNSTAHYGTKATVGAPIFSFVADEAAMYTVTVTASTGSGTGNLYSDLACTTSIVGSSVPGSVVYKKTTSDPETVYFAASVSNNCYISDVTIEKAELPDDVRTTYKGSVSGIESDDTNVQISLKSSTETLSISAEDYTSNGISLITGQTYEVTAKGDKGVYSGTSIVPDGTGTADLVLSRMIFDFPIDFTDNYDDYKIYLEAMGYGGSSDITDPYSGITVHPAGIVQTDSYKSYGVKTNSNSIISFVANQTGICTVTVNVSVSNADKLILTVNGEYAPILATAAQGSDVVLTTMVNANDVVTLYTPTRSNLWFKTIDVSYTDASFLIVESVLNTADNEVMIYGTVPTEFTSNIQNVGFYYTTAPVSTLENCVVGEQSSTVYTSVEYNGQTYSKDNAYVFATKLTDIADADVVYVYTFCTTTDGETYYSAPVKVDLK